MHIIKTNSDDQHCLYTVLLDTLSIYFYTRANTKSLINSGQNLSYSDNESTTQNTVIRELWQMKNKNTKNISTLMKY